MTFQVFPEKDSLKSRTGFHFFLLTFSFDRQALTGIPKEKVKNYNMKTIVIDPGHGGADFGATYAGRMEKNDNLRMGLAVRDRLLYFGQKVVMTRETDVFVGLLDRSVISNNSRADLFISLHRNFSDFPSANGWENFVRINPPLLYVDYAEKVLNECVAVGVQNNRGVKQGDYAVLRNTVAPAQLLEMGFLTNQIDNDMFDQKFSEYADAITRGILIALNEPTTPPVEPPIAPPVPGDPVIRNIQQTLNQRYNTGLIVDGIFGPNTDLAVRRFQLLPTV